jgi:hypothetical protein
MQSSCPPCGHSTVTAHHGAALEHCPLTWQDWIAMAACGPESRASCDARVIASPVGLALLGARRAYEEVTMTRKHGHTADGAAAFAGSAGLAARCAVLAVLAALAGAVAGCSNGSGSGPGSAPVASLAAGSAQARHGAAAQLTTEQSDLDMIHFARCMRSHGVAMSDPFHRPGHTGLSIGMPTQDAATRPAYAACTHFIQPIIQAKAGAQAQLPASRLAALTRWAVCMRSHDISMLDPTSAGQLDLGTVPGITSDFGRSSPQFHAADIACRHLLPAGVSDNGTGP